MLTRSPFPYMWISFSCSSSGDSEMMTMSSTHGFSHRHHVRNSWERASRTVMNSRGLRQESWLTPTFTLNFWLRLHPTRNLLLVFSYMLCIHHTSHFSAPSLPNDTSGYTEWLFQINKGHLLSLSLRQGFIQHKITHGSFTAGLHYKTIRTYWTNMNLT